MNCVTCKRKATIGDKLSMDISSPSWECDSCRITRIGKESAAKHERTAALSRAAAKVILTTTPSLHGYKILDYLGIESVEYVIGTGVFSEATSGIADLLGKRSRAFEDKLQQAKQETFHAIKMLAAERGANAVIGIDLDYTEFSGNRVALIVSGTLAIVEINN